MNNLFGFGLPELAVLIIIGIFFGITVVLPYWKVFSKAGFSGWLSLTQCVPLLNLVVIFYLAFAEWPIERELKQWRKGDRSPGDRQWVNSGERQSTRPISPCCKLQSRR